MWLPKYQNKHKISDNNLAILTLTIYTARNSKAPVSNKAKIKNVESTDMIQDLNKNNLFT